MAQRLIRFTGLAAGGWLLAALPLCAFLLFPTEIHRDNTIVEILLMIGGTGGMLLWCGGLIAGIHEIVFALAKAVTRNAIGAILVCIVAVPAWPLFMPILDFFGYPRMTAAERDDQAVYIERQRALDASWGPMV